MEFTIERVANMVFAGTEDHVWKAWMVDDFTERKLNNWMNKIRKQTGGDVTFIRKF